MRKRRDSTHKAIAAELRLMGFSVADTSQLGGFVDLVVSRWGFTIIVECKTPEGRKTAAERLREAQSDFASQWKGAICAAYTADDVVLAFYRELKKCQDKTSTSLDLYSLRSQ